MAERGKKGWKQLAGKIASKTGIVVLVIVVLLVAVRIALPYIIKDAVNKKLDSLPGYEGHIADVDLNIYRGAYVIQGIELNKSDGNIPVPFFSAEALDLSVEWSALFEGALVGEITFVRPEVNFVAGTSERNSQTGVDRSWQETVRDLFPLRINRFDIEDGEVHFRSYTSKPDIDVFIHGLNVTATNLTNSEEISESMVARVDASGFAMEDGKFKGHMDIDPFAEKPTFNLDAQLTNVSLPKLNNFLKAYGNFDVHRGRFSMFVECAASEGKFNGYSKPLLEDVQVVNWKEDKEDPARLLWESIVGAVAGLFTNKEEDRLATKIPLTGSFDDPSPDVWVTVANLLRNAFIRAIMPGLDQEIRFQAGR